MSHANRVRWLAALPLLCCLPVPAATVYKSIDENGVVTFSDTKPAAEILVETLVIDDPAPQPGGVAQQRLQDMRETTDRMVADRMAREKHRAELRQIDAQIDAQQSSQDLTDYRETSPIYTGFFPYPARRPWRDPDHRPQHPIARPPLLPTVPRLPPGVRPLPGNDYPASLIRKSYDPKVRAALE